MSTMDKKQWVRHSVAVPDLTREYTRIVKADDWNKDNKKGVHVTIEELVHVHDVYRRVGKDGKTMKELWHRGARVCSSS